MKRLVIPLTALVLLALACNLEQAATPTSAPATAQAPWTRLNDLAPNTVYTVTAQ